MYHWVDDRDFLKRAFDLCANIVNQLIQNLKKYGIDAKMNVVGSKSRNMITQNADQPIDFDFNLLIENSYDISSARDLKEDIRKAFNEVLSANGLDDCEDSTSALTTKKIHLKDGNMTPFSIDICIVKRDCYGLHRLIHKKTGYVDNDQWIWNLVHNTEKLDEKEKALKPDCWLEVREAYLEKKNLYLKRQEMYNHPSFNCYIEAVNEVYEKVNPASINQLKYYNNYSLF